MIAHFSVVVGIDDVVVLMGIAFFPVMPLFGSQLEVTNGTFIGELVRELVPFSSNCLEI